MKPAAPPSSCLVYTPRPLADAMVAALGVSSKGSYLEPCVGDGALLDALARRAIPRVAIRGLDVAPVKNPSDTQAQVLRGTDFLEWSRTTRERFGKIIANPPYVALNRLPKSLLASAIQVPDPFVGGTVRLRTNCWYAFLCASMNLLEANGSMCFLLPAALDFTDYAAALRSKLGAFFEEVHLHRSLSPLFEQVQDGSIVLLAHGYGKTSRYQFRTEHKDLAALVQHLNSATAIGESPTFCAGPEDRPQDHANTKLLGALVEIRIGAVTGDAKFFLLTEQQRKAARLPAAACVRVLTRASQLQSGTVGLAAWKKLKSSGERVWLFRPPDSLLGNPSVQRYFSLARRQGGCDRRRYKIKNREIWHRTPLPARPHGFISGMSVHGPWISLLPDPCLSASNTLYSIRFRTTKDADSRAAIALGLLTSKARAAMDLIGRRYADGLLKYEPSDLSRIPIPVTLDSTGATQTYDLAVKILLRGNSALAYRTADQWFQGR